MPKFQLCSYAAVRNPGVHGSIFCADGAGGAGKIPYARYVCTVVALPGGAGKIPRVRYVHICQIRKCRTISLI
jgi:hypothetical protein